MLVCRCIGAPHTDVYLTYEQINALPADKKEKWLSLAYQVDSNLMCGFDPEREPLYEELIEDYVNHRSHTTESERRREEGPENNSKQAKQRGRDQWAHAWPSLVVRLSLCFQLRWQRLV